MSGLYRRALQIYRDTSDSGGEAWDSTETSIDEIPETERDSVLRQIDNIIESNRLRVGAEEFRLSARSKGRALPLIANLAILLVAAVLLLFFSLRLNRQERLLQSGSQGIKTAESLVVRAVREESAQRLAAKDTEIQGIQEKLRKASLDRDAIRSEAAATIREREKTLESRVESAVTAERERLTALGLSAPDIERRLKDYESKLTASYKEQLAAFRAETEARAAQREREVAGVIASYQKTLAQSREERSRLEESYAAREAELARKVDEQSRQLENARQASQSQTEAQTQVHAQLSQLQQTAAQETLLSNQILTAYSTVRTDVTEKKYQSAIDTLTELRSSFDREPSLDSRAMQERRPVDMFIIGSLEELIRSRATGTVQAPRQEKPPSLEDSRVSDQLNAGSSAYAGSKWQQTLDEYRGALTILLDNGESADRLVSQVASAGYEIDARKDANRWAQAQSTLERARLLAARTQEVRSRIAASDSGPADNMSTEDLASLLEAKLLVWKIIGNEPVRSQYPKLFQTMQRYFDVFSVQQQEQGRQDALEEVLSVLRSIEGNTNVAAIANVQNASDRELLLQILDRVAVLVRNPQ